MIYSKSAAAAAAAAGRRRRRRRRRRRQQQQQQSGLISWPLNTLSGDTGKPIKSTELTTILMQLSCQQQPQEYCNGIPSHGSEIFLQDQMQGDLHMETSDHNLDAQ